MEKSFLPESEKENTSPSVEKIGQFIQQFSGEEVSALDATLLSHEKESTLTSQLKKIPRWKKALLSAVTLMATMGSVLPNEAYAENNRSEASTAGTAQTMFLENGKLKVWLENNALFHSVAAPETDQEENVIIAEKVQKLESALNNPELDKNIDYLQSFYGNTNVGIIAEIEYERQQVKAEQMATAENQKNVDNIFLAGLYDLFWNKAAILARADAEEKKPTIDGFDHNPDFSNKAAQKILNDMPPALSGHIDEIKYVDAHRTTTSYTFEAQAENIGLNGTFWNESGNVITFYNEKDFHGTLSEEYFKANFYHEIAGHGNDWDTSPRLTLNERLAMLVDVTQRFNDPTRQKNTYIDEAIPKEYKANDWDPREMRLRQVREFWAIAVENSRDRIKKETAEKPIPYGATVQRVVPISLGTEQLIPTPNPIQYELVNKWFKEMSLSK
jgi:hypothetical protein